MRRDLVGSRGLYRGRCLRADRLRISAAMKAPPREVQARQIHHQRRRAGPCHRSLRDRSSDQAADYAAGRDPPELRFASRGSNSSFSIDQNAESRTTPTPAM